MIPIKKPTIKRKDMDSVLSCMVSDDIGPGTLSGQFIAKVSDYLQCDGGLAFANYYFAIRFAFKTLGLVAGDKVITSALSPALYMQVFEDLELIPLVSDVDPDSGTILPTEVERLSADNEIKAIVVHYPLGIVPDIDAILVYDIPVIEDISQAFGAVKNEAKCGSLGKLAVVSTDEDGIITSGGGGLLLVNDKKYFPSLKALSESLAKEFFMPNLNASLGLSQIRKIGDLVERRNEIGKIFAQSLLKSRHKTLIQKIEADSVYYSFPVLINSTMNDVRKFARKKNVDTEPAFGHSLFTMIPELENNHYYQNAKSLVMRCLIFPCYPMLGKQNVILISKILAVLP
ncbi:MAG: DegT/DnrJ/EryC1/StrS aminotransferase family protein [Spirochaetales bacterium]|nr:DegT/DnrJ/EryC1/StrS aminotransferase family protein [Spirochaetales bacterium]